MRMKIKKIHGSQNSSGEINMQSEGRREENDLTLSMEDAHENLTGEEQSQLLAGHLSVYEEPVPI